MALYLPKNLSRVLSVIIPSLWIAVSHTSCDKGNFRAGSEQAQLETKLYSASCNQNAQATVINESLLGLKGSSVQIKGEFCAVELDNKPLLPSTILFVVDESGSNNQSDPGGFLNLGCGRLSAADSKLKELEKISMQGASAPNFQIGLITFGSKARVRVPFTNLATFRSQHLTSAKFCDAIDYTNYEDAFDSAEFMLQNVAGPKTIYFVSDGVPAGSGTARKNDYVLPSELDPNQNFAMFAQKGLQAARNLRARFGSELILYGLFLNKDATFGSSIPGYASPEAYLREVIGIPTNLVVVSDAGKLAAQIAMQQPAKPAAIDTANAIAELSAPSFQSRNVGMASLAPVPNQPGTYAFLTNPVELFGRINQEVLNKITIRVKASDGKMRQATATIRFTQGD